MTTSADIHAESLVLDFHTDLLSRMIASGDGPEAFLDELPGHVDLPRARKGGVDCFVCALFTANARKTPPVVRTLAMIDRAWEIVRAAPDRVTMATTAGEIREARRTGRLAFFLSIENGVALGGRLSLLRIYHRLGVRAMGLVWNGRNELGAGCQEGSAEGLSDFGRAVVEEMGRLGMIVDVSHLTEQGFWDVADMVEGPFIASHSNARAWRDHPRNLTDTQIQTLAEKGGVMGLNFYSSFLTEENGEATVEDLLRHLDHIVQVTGSTDHVGLGSDYDGISSPPDGLEDASTFPRFTEALVDAGYDREAIEKILGGNFLRVIEEVVGA